MQFIVNKLRGLEPESPLSCQLDGSRVSIHVVGPIVPFQANVPFKSVEDLKKLNKNKKMVKKSLDTWVLAGQPCINGHNILKKNRVHTLYTRRFICNLHLLVCFERESFPPNPGWQIALMPFWLHRCHGCHSSTVISRRNSWKKSMMISIHWSW